MHFDFAAILVLATFLTGAIWAFDSIFYAPRRKAAFLEATGSLPQVDENGKRPGEPLVVEYARSFFPVILIVDVVDLQAAITRHQSAQLQFCDQPEPPFCIVRVRLSSRSPLISELQKSRCCWN